MMPQRTIIHRRVDAAKTKRNPAVICQLPSGWVVMADDQVTPGCCQLLPDPVVQYLNSLDNDSRAQFLCDMALVGDAIMEVTDAYSIHYEILGNADLALHANIYPRYMSEPEQFRKLPAWYYYELNKRMPPGFDAERDKELMRKIANSIQSKL